MTPMMRLFHPSPLPALFPTPDVISLWTLSRTRTTPLFPPVNFLCREPAITVHLPLGAALVLVSRRFKAAYVGILGDTGNRHLGRYIRVKLSACVRACIRVRANWRTPLPLPTEKFIQSMAHAASENTRSMSSTRVVREVEKKSTRGRRSACAGFAMVRQTVRLSMLVCMVLASSAAFAAEAVVNWTWTEPRFSSRRTVM